MLVIDFEVFKYDWLAVVMDTVAQSEQVIINDSEQLEKLYREHCKDVWLGYNIRGYDQWILKGILCGFNPKHINDYIIEGGNNGATFSSQFRSVPLCFFDVKTTPDSLKTLEGFMGSDIRETTVPFNIDRKLTASELSEVVKYCRHDVEQTYLVFTKRIEEFTSQLELAQMFGMDKSALGRTKAQLSAIALGARQRADSQDEFDFSIPTNLRISKYASVIEWFEARRGAGAIMYSDKLETSVAGVPHVFAWGGLHGALPKYHEKGVFINCDVASYYPSLMLEYGYISRAIKDPAHYADIYHKRLAYKAAKDKRQQPLKIVLNSTYGAMKDRFNALYDPLQANNVCVTGQLLLLDLIEQVEVAGCADLVQSNTDGVLFKLRGVTETEINANFSVLDDVCHEWEQRTKMRLEFDEFSEVWQKDVNNYVMMAANGTYKSKGAYVKKLSDLDNDLPIVNKALLAYMVHGTPIAKTVEESTDLIDFQKIFRVSSKYRCAFHNGRELSEKTFRVFASRDARNTPLYKIKAGGNPEKFANCPEACFIDNGDMIGKPVPPELDRAYYVELARKRLSDFL